MASKCLKSGVRGCLAGMAHGSLAWQTSFFFPEPYPSHAFSVPHFCAAYFTPEQQGALLFSCCGSDWSTFLYLWWEAHTRTHILTLWVEGIRWAIEGWVFCFFLFNAEGFRVSTDESAIKALYYYRMLAFGVQYSHKAVIPTPQGPEASDLCKYLRLLTHTHTPN